MATSFTDRTGVATAMTDLKGVSTSMTDFNDQNILQWIDQNDGTPTTIFCTQSSVIFVTQTTDFLATQAK